jgi:hypothetical protein
VAAQPESVPGRPQGERGADEGSVLDLVAEAGGGLNVGSGLCKRFPGRCCRRFGCDRARVGQQPGALFILKLEKTGRFAHVVLD